MKEAQRPLAAPRRTCIPPRAWARASFTGWRHAAVGGGVALFCCSGEIWHGDERERRGESETAREELTVRQRVWTENLRMGSNDWKHIGKRQTCLYFPLSLSLPHSHTLTHTHSSTGRSVARLIVNTIGYHCRQVHLPSCEYVPRCIQLQVPCEYLFSSSSSSSSYYYYYCCYDYFRSKANAPRPQNLHRQSGDETTQS